jgi:hypothetical protein
LISPATHLDAIHAEGKVFYLSGIAAFIDINYGLYQCDSLGFVCRQIFRSGDYSLADPMSGKLEYSIEDNVIEIDVGVHGIIHKHSLK